MIEHQELMTPGEVADLFRVNRNTVLRWAKTGRLPAIMTPGGHRRYVRATVDELYAELSSPEE